MGFLSETELQAIGFKSIGKNVLISDKTSFYTPELMTIGSNIRIDDFCILSGSISLGNYIHISAYNALYGKHGIFMDDFSGLSPRCTVFSASDDFSGDFMIGPMVPSILNNIIGGRVTIGKYVQVGSNSVVLPNVIINEGSVIGAMSLVKRSINPWGVYGGIPAKFIRHRSKKLLDLSRTIENS